MIVIAIIAILAATAIMQFNSYRMKGFNTGAIWDMKNAAVAQEAYYVDYRAYTSSLNQLDGYGLSSTEDVTLSVDGNNEAYTLVSYHGKGDKTYTLTGPGGTITSN
jgi:Tfp pilus assembly protein PilE